jgi:dienelactone hydrolase
MKTRREGPADLARRRFIQMTASAACLPLTACGNQIARKMFPGTLADFREAPDLPLRTFEIGPTTGRPVVVLHELPGLTRDDLALARAFSQQGFRIFAPLLFGEPEQDSVRKGYQQACDSKLFECGELSRRCAILDKLGPLCDEIALRTRSPIAVVGMCLTGVFPLALLPHNVAAAVVCQPTVPFSLFPPRPTGPQKSDLGLGSDDLSAALSSKVPFMVLRYSADGRCPPERVAELRRRFATRVATIELPGDHHSSLAGDFHRSAFDDAVDYLKVRFDPTTGPRTMRLTKLQPEHEKPCEIGSDGLWHAG